MYVIKEYTNVEQAQLLISLHLANDRVSRLSHLPYPEVLSKRLHGFILHSHAHNLKKFKAQGIKTYNSQPACHDLL